LVSGDRGCLPGFGATAEISTGSAGSATVAAVTGTDQTSSGYLLAFGLVSLTTTTWTSINTDVGTLYAKLCVTSGTCCTTNLCNSTNKINANMFLFLISSLLYIIIF
jgi:hypothetical protein